MFSIKLLNQLFVGLFFLIICLPSIGLMLGITSKIDNIEGRSFQSFPALSKQNLIEFPKALSEHYDSNYGFRSLMIRKVLELKLLYSKSPDGSRTIIGKAGWYFMSLPEGSQPPIFTTEELEIIRQKFEKQQEIFSQKNIPFIIAIVPDKEAIYSEYYPLPVIPADAAVDQLITYLKNNSKVDIIDLRDLFSSLKNGYSLYYRTDSHWTNYGAFIAYQEILKEINDQGRNIYIPQLSDFDIKEEYYLKWRGDLGFSTNTDQDERLNIGVKFTPKPQLLAKEKLYKAYVKGDSFFEISHHLIRKTFLDTFPEMTTHLGLIFKNPEGEEDLRLKDNPDQSIKIIEKNIGDKTLQKNLINYLINSLAIDEEKLGLGYFFPYTFKYITLDPQPNDIVFDQKIIDQEQPDVVIFEIIQRNIKRLSD